MCENYSRDLVKVVIAQITQGMGFHAIQQSACDALADILQLYIEEIGYSSHLYAEHTSRVESNFHDICRSFEDLGVSLQDLYTFAANSDEIAFAKAVPAFPTPRSDDLPPPELRDPEDPFPPHIPAFLPPFPDKHTYATTPVFAERITDPRVLRRAKSKQKRQLEKSLYELSSKIGVKTVASYEALKQQKQNPYMAPARSARETSRVPPTPPADTIMAEAPAATPITDLSPYSDVLAATGDEQGRDELQEKRPVHVMDIDDSEKARKRAKVEKILSLSHHDGIVDSLETGGADKDGDT